MPQTLRHHLGSPSLGGQDEAGFGVGNAWSEAKLVQTSGCWRGGEGRAALRCGPGVRVSGEAPALPPSPPAPSLQV